MQIGEWRSSAKWTPWLVTALVLIADRISKLYIRDSLPGFESIPVIPGLFRIIHTENPGAAFGVLADGNPWLRGLILIGVSTVVLLFVAGALLNSKSSYSGLATRIALALILGGAIGNLYDRVIRGTVTDFLEVYRGSWSFPAFNVADSAITVGSALLLIDLIRPRRHVSQAH